MTNLSIQGIESWKLRRLFDGLNLYNTAEGLAKAVEAEFPAGYQFDRIVAQAILDTRARIPGAQYDSIAQLEKVPGLSEAEFQDMVAAFGLPAAELFVRNMYDGVILENWQLQYERIAFPDEITFQETVNDPDEFQSWLLKQVGMLASARTGMTSTRRQAKKSLRKACPETFASGNVASYALALWFYRFDQDNWFSFNQVRTEAEKYLDYFTLFDERTELRLYTGFDNSGTLATAITVTGLPVVVNYAERAITIWSASLFD